VEMAYAPVIMEKHQMVNHRSAVVLIAKYVGMVSVIAVNLSPLAVLIVQSVVMDLSLFVNHHLLVVQTVQYVKMEYVVGNVMNHQPPVVLIVDQFVVMENAIAMKSMLVVYLIVYHSMAI